VKEKTSGYKRSYDMTVNSNN